VGNGFDDDWNATDKWAEADRQAVCYLSLYAPTPLLFTVYSFTAVPIAVYNDQRRQFIGLSPTNTYVVQEKDGGEVIQPSWFG